MRFEIRHLQRQIGMTTVLVTHDQEEALSMSDHIVVMNKGNVEQEGSPANIYQKPKTSFVASFIGETNLFRGHIERYVHAEGFMLFKADCGFEACIRSANNLEPGRQVLLSLRPETLMISAGDASQPATPNALRGTVLGVNYLGARTVFEIKTATRELLVSVQNEAGSSGDAHNTFTEGQEVTLSWTPESCQTVEAH
jgi:ABC-type Fe3+/spermidine/putrescine transport system ATPase subunit